jgi:ATP-dependent helicase YprA (DUF1998 family)
LVANQVRESRRPASARRFVSPERGERWTSVREPPYSQIATVQVVALNGRYQTVGNSRNFNLVVARPPLAWGR